MIADIGRRIAEKRKQKNMTQDQLAEAAILSRVTVARYEAGKLEPGAQALDRIADALEVTTDELLGKSERIAPFLRMSGAVPVVGSIACGQPITADQNIDGYVTVPEGVHADFALVCKGDSMRPTFLEGDYVLIRQQPEVENGQIAAVGIGGDATLKHVYRMDDGLLLTADNPAFPPLREKNLDGVVVYGLAVGYVRMLG